MAINYVKGELLAANLLRAGVDLAIETNLLYVDVTTGRIGINNATPLVALDVVGAATLGDISLSGTTIAGTATDTDLFLSANGTGEINASGKVITNVGAAGADLTAAVNLQVMTDAITASVLSTDVITAGDSSVTVVDVGTGRVNFELDAVQVAVLTSIDLQVPSVSFTTGTATVDPATDVLLAATDGIAITTAGLTALDIVDIPDYGFDTASIAYTTNTATFTGLTGVMGSVFFAPDGFAMYVVNTTANPGTIEEYLLGTAWDLSTKSTLNASLIMSSLNHADDMRGVWFNEDGTKAIVSGPTQWASYTFATPYDVANGVFVNVATQIGGSTGASALWFTPDGTKAYKTSGSATWFVHAYTVATPWDVSTISATEAAQDITTEITAAGAPLGASLSIDGTLMFIPHLTSGGGSTTIEEYTLSTPYLPSTRTATDTKVVTEGTDPITYPFWSPTGIYLFLIDDDTIYRYSSTAVTINGVTTRLYHEDNLKLNTTGAGALITGNLEFTGADSLIIPPTYATASLPATPSNGGVVYDSDTLTLKYYDGTVWQTVRHVASTDATSVGDYVLFATTTDATITEALTTAAGRLVLPDDTTWRFEVDVVARRTDADNESAGYKFTGVIDRQTGAASTAIVGAVAEVINAEDNAAWVVTVDADATNGSLRVQVTGEAAKTAKWVASVRTVEVTN